MSVMFFLQQMLISRNFELGILQSEPCLLDTITDSTDPKIPVNSGKRWDRFLRVGAANSVWLGVVAVWLASVVANLHPWLELATHFSYHFMWFTGLATGLSLYHRIQIRWLPLRKGPKGLEHRYPPFSPNRLRGLTHLGAFLYFLVIVSPWNLWGAPVREESLGSIRVLTWNVWLKNRDATDLLKIVQDAKADVVALYEVNPELGKEIEELKRAYPESMWTPEWDPGSMIVLSRIPGTTFRELDLGNVGRKAIEIDVPGNSQGAPCQFLAMHTHSPNPWRPDRTNRRNRQLMAAADWVKDRKVPSVVMGDLNVTPYSPVFRTLLNRGKLTDSRKGFGNQATWRSRLGRFGIPIDHILVSREFTVIDRWVIRPSPGSDHSPVLAELGFRKVVGQVQP